MLLMAEAYARAEPTQPESQGRTEAVLAFQHRGQLETIKQEFVQAGLRNVHFQFMRKGQPPPNIGLGPEVSADQAREAIRLALKYNQDIQILLPERLFPSRFITIASSNFDDTVEFPIDKAQLEHLQDPSLTTEEFHELYRRLTSGPARAQKSRRSDSIARTVGNSSADLEDHRKQMLKNAEEMVAHGGMGDAQAIVHHCQEARKEAEILLSVSVQGNPHGEAITNSLQDVVRYCERVAQIGPHADPGQLLNPATKARAAAHEAAKHLTGLQKPIR